MLLVPTEAHVEIALAEMDGELGAGPRVLSARRFVQGALAALVTDRAPAPPLAVALATHFAVKEVARERLARPVQPAGEPLTEATAVALGDTIDRAIGTLRRSGRAPAGAARRSLYQWASAVQERVDARLRAAGWFDARGAGHVLARAIAGATDAQLRELGVLGGVTLDFVLPWDAADMAWIEALHRRSLAAEGGGALLRLPRFSREDGHGPLASAEDPLAAALERRWAALDPAPEIVWVSAPSPSVIAVRSARTPSAEARAVAAEALAALAAGVPPERVAIVVPRASDEASLRICAELAEARVPCAEARGRSILASPDGRAAIAMLALAEGPFTRDGLLEVLRAPGLHAEMWVETASDAEASERVARLASRLRDVPVDIDGSGRLFVEAVAALAAEDPDDAWMPRAIERLVDSARRLPEGGTLGEGLRRFVALLDRTKLGQPRASDLTLALQDEKRGHGVLSVAAMGESASAVRRLRALAVELDRAAARLGLDGAPLSAAGMRALLGGLAERTAARAGGSAARAAAVRLASPEDVAGLPYERLIVTGLVESAYGDEAEADDLLEAEGEAEGSARPEGRAEPRAPRRSLALAAALSSARSAVLTYALGDDDDFDKPHATVVDALARGVPSSVEPASRVSPRASSLGPRSASLIALAAGRPPPSDLAERVRIERARHAFFMDPRAPADEHTGMVRLAGGLGDVMPELVGGRTEQASIAVTAIERAVGCAFAGFARRVLRVQRRQDMSEAGDPRERGTLVHRALRVVFDVLRAAMLEEPEGSAAEAAEPVAFENPFETRGSLEGAARAAAFAAARAAAERELGLDRAASPLRREAISSAVRDALGVMARTLDEEISMRFLLGEQRFGAGSPPPWSALPLPAEPDEDGAPTVFVDGQIDRIDATSDLRLVRVIDYKTGRLPEGDARRLALQLPMYAAAAARAFGAMKVEAMYLRVTSRGMIDEFPKRPEQRLVRLEELAERARDARRAVRALWEGRVAPRPASLSLCASCDARDVCRRPAVMPIEEWEDRS